MLRNNILLLYRIQDLIPKIANPVSPWLSWLSWLCLPFFRSEDFSSSTTTLLSHRRFVLASSSRPLRPHSSPDHILLPSESRMSQGQKRPGSPQTTTQQPPKKIRVTFAGASHDRSLPEEMNEEDVVPGTPPRRTPPGDDALQEKVNGLANLCDKLATGHDHVNERLDTLQDDIKHRFDALMDQLSGINQTVNKPASPDHLAVGQAHADDPRAIYGNAPKKAMFNYLPHISESLLTEILDGALKCKDLIKLLPEEDRPKGRSAGAGLGAGFHIDTAGVLSAVPEGSSMAAFEKDFPDLYTAILVLSTYGAIRDMYDVDEKGIGGAIHHNHIFWTTLIPDKTQPLAQPSIVADTTNL
jgi:hypothetical protein